MVKQSMARRIKNFQNFMWINISVKVLIACLQEWRKNNRKSGAIFRNAVET